MSKVGRPKKDVEQTQIKEELLKFTRPQKKTKTGKQRAPVPMFTGSEQKMIEGMTKDSAKRIINYLKKTVSSEKFEPYPHPFKPLSELSAKEASEQKAEKDLSRILQVKLQKYFGVKEESEGEEEYEREQESIRQFGVPSQESTQMPSSQKKAATKEEKKKREQEEAMFGVPSQEPSQPPSKQAKKKAKKAKAMAEEIELGENPNEPVEEKLKREIKQQKPKVVINAPPEKPAQLPKGFSYVQEPVGLQERPPQASPILSFSNKDFVARPMKGDVSSLPEKDRLDPAPVKPEPEPRPIMNIPQFGDVAGYEFSQYQGYRPIVPTQKLEARFNDEPEKDEIGAIQIDMVRNASGNNQPSRDQRFAAENEPIKEGGVMVQSLHDEIYTPDEIYRIRNMPPEEFLEYMEGSRRSLAPDPRKGILRFQPIPPTPQLKIPSQVKPIDPINFSGAMERMGQPHAYTEDELKVMRAENANKVMTELTEAKANREQDKTIGNRENTGLATRFSIPGKDLLVKPEEEIKKSISAFANMSWIEDGARADSKLGRYSSLQQMVDAFEERRYSDVYTPISVQPKTRQHLYELYKRDIEGITNNRRVPEYDGHYTQERVPEHERDLRAYGARPVGSRYPTLNNIEDYTYDHCCVVGTQNLGMSNQYQDYTRPYFRDDHLQFPNTIFEHRTHKQRFI
jgi:hypothetical protein